MAKKQTRTATLPVEVPPQAETPQAQPSTPQEGNQDGGKINKSELIRSLYDAGFLTAKPIVEEAGKRGIELNANGVNTVLADYKKKQGRNGSDGAKRGKTGHAGTGGGGISRAIALLREAQEIVGNPTDFRALLELMDQ